MMQAGGGGEAKTKRSHKLADPKKYAKVKNCWKNGVSCVACGCGEVDVHHHRVVDVVSLVCDVCCAR